MEDETSHSGSTIPACGFPVASAHTGHGETVHGVGHAREKVAPLLCLFVLRSKNVPAERKKKEKKKVRAVRKAYFFRKVKKCKVYGFFFVKCKVL